MGLYSNQVDLPCTTDLATLTRPLSAADSRSSLSPHCSGLWALLCHDHQLSHPAVSISSQVQVQTLSLLSSSAWPMESLLPSSSNPWPGSTPETRTASLDSLQREAGLCFAVSLTHTTRLCPLVLDTALLEAADPA